jgi:hypothetical protein
MLSGKNLLREKNYSDGRDQARHGPFETSLGAALLRLRLRHNLSIR